MFPFGNHPRANGLRAARDHPVLLLLRSRCQQQVQLLQVLHAWHGHQIVPPELAPFALHASFLVSLAWRTELRCESPVRAKTDEPRSFFPLMAAQDFLHGTLQVVVTQNTEDTAKIGERQLMRFQKRLLIGVRISPMKGATAGHAAQAENVRLAGLAVELDPAFVPIHLRLATELIRLRHKDFMPQQAHSSLPGAHILTNRRFCYLGVRSLTALSLIHI